MVGQDVNIWRSRVKSIQELSMLYLQILCKFQKAFLLKSHFKIQSTKIGNSKSGGVLSAKPKGDREDIKHVKDQHI